MAVFHDNVPVTIACVVSHTFMENAFVISLDGNSDCLVVDPSFDSVSLKQQIEDNGLTPTAILNTHGHSDHIAGNSTMKDTFPSAELVIGEKDAFKLTDPVANLSAQYGIHIKSPPADRTLAVEGVLPQSQLPHPDFGSTLVPSTSFPRCRPQTKRKSLTSATGR